MTYLLVSVRNADEAVEALAGGADVIDVKEPRHGSLGAARPATWDAVRLAVRQASSVVPRPKPTPVLLSAALGELLDERTDRLEVSLAGYAHAKLGLAGCRAVGDWADRWRERIAELPPACRAVAVVYADHAAADAPAPRDVLAAAARMSVRTLLVDTCGKEGGDLWRWMTDDQLSDLMAAARSAGLQIALAGSITLQSLERALRLTPDWIAVRGAVCRGGRESPIERELVKQFAARLSTPCRRPIPDPHTAQIDSAIVGP